MLHRHQSYQRQFFDRLAKKFSTRAEMVAGISSVLVVGRDAVYRRMRGDTTLSADELVALAREYKIGLEMNRERRMAAFLVPGADRRLEAEIDYYRQFRQHTSQIINFPDVSIDYATAELPIFYELSQPLLARFKTFMFGITSWRLERWQALNFDPALIHPGVLDYIDEIVNDSFHLPGRELWSVSIMDVTCRQIEYMVEVHRLRDADLVEQLYQELHNIVDHLETMARMGQRFLMGSQPTPDSPTFEVHMNELSNTNNCVIIHTSEQPIVFTTITNPGYAISTDRRIYDSTTQWFDSLLQHSTRLGPSSAKYTAVYFAKLREKLNSSRTRVVAELLTE